MCCVRLTGFLVNGIEKVKQTHSATNSFDARSFADSQCG